ncbi:MAG: hypothetical protein ACREOI_12095 [bacterium]
MLQLAVAFCILLYSNKNCTSKNREKIKMVSNELGKQLHDRATRGDALSPDEKAQLEEWYKTQDRDELAVLGLSATVKKVKSLQTQVDVTLAQLTTITSRIKKITEENEALRREITALSRQLAQRLMPETV